MMELNDYIATFIGVSFLGIAVCTGLNFSLWWAILGGLIITVLLYFYE